ncbi:MAG TPA: TIGR01777 family oxidoreductase [bacterium]|nr:TIGR01777 family oxidoreductase [bacterium]
MADTIVITGSHGLLASALMPRLVGREHRILRLVRARRLGPDQFLWDPVGGTIDVSPLKQADAVVHLAGEPIPALRWSRAKMARIYDSRVKGTRLLSEALAGLSRRPRVMISASASGYYGDRGEEELTEESSPGDTFLARVCRDWEAATEPARSVGIRVVHIRSGNVMTRRRGFLGPQVPLFRLGLGGRLGSGRQYVPWVAVDDWVSAVEHLLAVESLMGPVNVVSSQTVMNREFTATLARVLRRPAVLAVPAAALKLVMGELGAELLRGQRMTPAALMESGFSFRHAELESALRHVLRA